jgi:heat shock protein HslJ
MIMKKRHYLLFVCCLLSLAACTIFKKSDGAAASATDFAGRRWKLVELAGKPVPNLVNGKEPFLLLQKNDLRFLASGGCNGLGGTFTFEPNGRIKFTRGMSTKMACADMEVERGLSAALDQADNYSVSGDDLLLNKARMAPLARFKAVK